jgi:glycogen debranching enzyme
MRTGVPCCLLAAACGLAFIALRARAQEGGSQEDSAGSQFDDRLALNTEAVAPQRFIAVHGRRALVDGYASEGLEVWAYPFQIVSGYRVAFRPAGATTATDGADILRRVIYEPDSVTRIYLGPGFTVREKIFVPLNEPGAIFTYRVEGGKQVDIEIHATPVLNLMWPAAVGGQSTAWNASLQAFVLSEPANGFTAVMGSPEIAAHDQPDNRTSHGAAEAGMGFTVRPGASGVTRVFIALNPPHAADGGLLLKKLIADSDALEAEAAAHYGEAELSLLHVETPDERVNQAIAWAEIALDQAWVCNPDLGCGYVAGYGPSRGARRPQYDWFFAGDGLVAADAALAAGDRIHARDELQFILRYQDKKTGMIWHELSQSAGFLDWANKYPYMYVHVDITFQFLGSVARYAAATGDRGFVTGNWPAIEAAYRYCLTLIDPETGLPRISADKEGGDEQDRMSDDLGLSAGWVDAAASFAQLAALGGHAALADEASRAAQHARASIPAHYWNDADAFWISGHTGSGAPMAERRSSPAEALTLHLFNPQQSEHLLDQIASSDFQTDWGSRGVGAGSAAFDPESYAKGSVWPVHTAGLAEAFWSEHRPVTALQLWRALLPLVRLDSLGHMPEVLAGDFYRPQIESVPEQTWSSAGFLQATIHGLLGLRADSSSNHLAFAPQLPAEWSGVSISQIQISGASVSLALQRTGEGFTLKIANSGAPFQFEFAPDLPLGATLRGAMLNHRPIAATVENHSQQTIARVAVTVPHGESDLQLALQGGVSIIPDVPEPQLGDASVGIRIVDVHLAARELTLVVDVPASQASRLRLKSAWEVAGASGATAKQIEAGLEELTFAADQNASAPYHRVEATIEFKP